jgi:benzoate/toluate 1,2-dioxygenase reductase component
MIVYSAELEDRCWLSDTAFEVALTRPPGFVFTAGQRIRVNHADSQRDYSLSSPPTDPRLTLCVKLIKGGFFTPFLATVRPGSRLRFTGPHGYFTYRTTGRLAVFIATGTGIAPFVSMARSGVHGFLLVHGVSNEEELYFADLWQGTAERYIPCVSQPHRSNDLPRAMFKGRVTDVLDDILTEGVYDFYLAGNGDMIREMTHHIDELYPHSTVYTEPFF